MLTIDTRDVEHNELRRVRIGADVDLEPDIGIKLVCLVTRKRLPCLQSIARLLLGIVLELVCESSRVGRCVRYGSERRDDSE